MIPLAEQSQAQALLTQLQSEAAPGATGAGQAGCLLRHLQALAAGGTEGEVQLQLQQHAEGRPASSSGATFAWSYAQEVQRLRLFLKSSLEALWLALLDACSHLQAMPEELLQAGTSAGGQLGARLAAFRAGFDAMGEELVLLERFLRQNAAACAQLAQMHDKPEQWGGPDGTAPAGQLEGAYLDAAQGALLGDLRLEPLVVGLSDAYELCRGVESDAAALAGQPDQWVPPDTFQRVTRKFWLQPGDLMRFKTEVIRHLPVLIFGDRQKLTEGCPHDIAFLRDQHATSDSADIASVYYDNPASLASYHERLRKDDKASVVRLRWYGERAVGAPDQRIFVERKVHREKASGERSYKERASIEQRYVADYTGGTGAPPEMLEGKRAEFLQEAQGFLVQGGQVPLLRTCYRRTAFQEASNNMVRISLDAGLHMVREHGAPRRPGDWCRDMSAPLPPQDVVHFPYAVVEVKLQVEPPEWVVGLLDTGLLLPVPKFSKYLHGTALLFQHSCLNVPYWFLPDEHDSNLMSPATWEEMANPADEFLQNGAKSASWLFPSGADDRGANQGPTDPAVPYTPSPLRFLRRNKPAPAPRSPSGGAGVTAVNSGSLQVAGGLPRAPPAVASTQPAEPLPLLSPGVPAGAAAQPPQHPRNHTWPVYQNPVAALQPLARGAALLSHPLSTASQPLQPGGGLPAGENAAPVPTRPSSSHSQLSTPNDSAQDLEAGHKPASGAEQGAQKAGGQAAYGVGGFGKPLGAGASVAAVTAAAGGAGAGFGALQGRLPGAPPPNAGNGAGAVARNGRPKVMGYTRVEPKTFFANERTFLSWLQISVLIMMTATSLLSGSGLLSSIGVGGSGGSCNPKEDKSCLASKLSGAVIAPVALLFMAYALYMYKKRTYQIMRRETVRYDDQRGPVVLVVILLLVFTLSYVMAMIGIF